MITSLSGPQFVVIPHLLKAETQSQEKISSSTNSSIRLASGIFTLWKPSGALSIADVPNYIYHDHSIIIPLSFHDHSMIYVPKKKQNMIKPDRKQRDLARQRDLLRARTATAPTTMPRHAEAITGAGLGTACPVSQFNRFTRRLGR